MSREDWTSLRQLARLFGVQCSYTDVFGRRHTASADSLMATLRALGAPVSDWSDLQRALREKRLADADTRIAPCVVAWQGRATIPIRLPAHEMKGLSRCSWRLESGPSGAETFDLGRLPTVQEIELEGVQYLVKRLRLGSRLPLGYHQFELELSDQTHPFLVIAAPPTTYPLPENKENLWGAFLPLYALRTASNWGAGNLGDLEQLLRYVADLGGNILGTLPILASFLDRPFDPSPYSPASRLFWNEFYTDIPAVAEFEACPEAKAMVGSSEFQAQIQQLRASEHVNYRDLMALKRTVLEMLARRFFERRTIRFSEFQRFLDTVPALDDYACFRAAGELRGQTWRNWEEPARAGTLTPNDYEIGAKQYHMYVQWVVTEQLERLSRTAKEVWPGLYLDLPLGVHGSSYDVWRHGDAFALAAAGGAPPDAVFTSGQNWGFPPLHPERLRRQQYRYFIASLRQQFRYAGLLRIDHVMGLHRLFWIPDGMDASDGVYVRYHDDELYAILCLESHRNRAAVVGENLGTVPAKVNAALKRRGLHGMYIVEYELALGKDNSPRSVPENAIADLNTHDMFPFAAFLRGLDLRDRRALGLLEDESLAKELKDREESVQSLVEFLCRMGCLQTGQQSEQDVIRGCLDWLARSRAGMVLINMENIWAETNPQNVPGTQHERANWKRKARYGLSDFREPSIAGLLETVNLLRKSKKHLD